MRFIFSPTAVTLTLMVLAYPQAPSVPHVDAQTVPPSTPAQESHVAVPCKPSGSGNGHVTVHVHVSKDGVPSEERVTKSSGDDCLDRKAIVSVHITHFNPAMQNGKPVAADLEIDINMHTDDSTTTPTPKVN